MRKVSFSFAAALSLMEPAAATAFAQFTCVPDRSVCIFNQPGADGTGIEFWVQSSRVCPLTLTLDVKSTRTDQSWRWEGSIDPGARRRLFSPGVKSEVLHYSFNVQCGRREAVHDDSARYELPLEAHRPVRVSQGFHGLASHTDRANAFALDFRVPENTPVLAARDGEVVEVEDSFRAGGPNQPAQNVNVVRIEHADGTLGEYAHLRERGAAVKAGQRVAAGELIGFSGNTGKSTGAHLHFAVHTPLNGRERRSVPVYFATSEGARTELRAGRDYLRPSSAQ